MTGPEEWFHRIDADGNGSLDVFELHQALSLAGLNLSLKMVKALMRLHDSGKGRIHLAAFKQLHHWLLNIGAGFQRFDHDHSGTLSKEETYQALQYAGFQLAPAAFDALFHSFDPDEDQTLSMVEFTSMAVHLQSARNVFAATDTQRAGKVTMDFDQFVWAFSKIG